MDKEKKDVQIYVPQRYEKDHLYHPKVMNTFTHLVSFFHKFEDNMKPQPWGKKRYFHTKSAIVDGIQGWLFGFFGGSVWYGTKTYYYFRYAREGDIKLQYPEVKRVLVKQGRKVLRVAKSFFLFSFIFKFVSITIQKLTYGNFNPFLANTIGAGVAGGVLGYTPSRGKGSFARGFIVGFILIALLESIINVEGNVFGVIEFAGIDLWNDFNKNPWGHTADWTGIHIIGNNMSDKSYACYDSRKFNPLTLFPIDQRKIAIEKYWEDFPVPDIEDLYFKEMTHKKNISEFGFDNPIIERKM